MVISRVVYIHISTASTVSTILNMHNNKIIAIYCNCHQAMVQSSQDHKSIILTDHTLLQLNHLNFVTKVVLYRLREEAAPNFFNNFANLPQIFIKVGRGTCSSANLQYYWRIIEKSCKRWHCYQDFLNIFVISVTFQTAENHTIKFICLTIFLI